MTKAPAIPISVKYMQATYAGCESLVTAPVIPDNVQELYGVFEGCTSLTGTVEINCDNLTAFDGIFDGTEKPIVLTGDCPRLAEIAAQYDNVTVAE